MISDFRVQLIGQFQFTLFDQICQKLRIMNHLEITAEFGLLIFQCVIAVGTGSNNLFNVVAFKNFNILLRHNLELEFITGPSRRSLAPFAIPGKPPVMEPVFMAWH